MIIVCKPYTYIWVAAVRQYGYGLLDDCNGPNKANGFAIQYHPLYDPVAYPRFCAECKGTLSVVNNPEKHDKLVSQISDAHIFYHWRL